MVFWALAEREKAKERMQQEIKAENRARVARERGNVIAAVVEAYELMLEEARERARAEGINLDKYLKP